MTSVELPGATQILHQPASVLRWTFLGKGRTLTCEIMVNGSHSYDVCVIPHWDVASSIIEPYDSLASALSHHAEFASRLRETGWMRISETPIGERVAA